MNHPLYTAYVNDKPVKFMGIYEDRSLYHSDNADILSEAGNSVDDLIERLSHDKNCRGIIYLSNSPARSWEEFVSRFKLQEAAGGIVRNENNEFLVIFRKGVWDLPKGKIDYDESPEDAAIREVREECGVSELKLIAPAGLTFHTYVLKKKAVLKKTHWYLMESSSEEKLIPQTDEQIDIVRWMNEQEIRETFYSNTYNSIKSLLENFFENKSSFKGNKS